MKKAACFILSIIFLSLFFTNTALSQKTITVDFAKEIAKIKDLTGVNRVPENSAGLRGFKRAGVSAIRFHDERVNDYQNYTDFWNFDSVGNEFTRINENFNPYAPAHYNWSEIDATINRVNGSDIDIYFRVGVSWPHNSNYPTPPLTAPLDPGSGGFVNFAELVRHTAMHFNQGWDNGYRDKIKYWEIWNEPGGIFWKGSPRQFYKMYRAVALTLKQHDSNLKVGGPGAVPSTVVIPKDEYLKDFLDYLAAGNIPLDFYSWHLYGIKNPYGVKYWAESIRKALDDAGFVNAESHITEINDELNDSQKLLHNNALGAVYALAILLTAQESPVDKMFWYPGEALLANPLSGSPELTWNAYAFKILNLMYENTPLEIESIGNEVVEGHWQERRPNFMTLAAKSGDNCKVFLTVANFYSEIRSYDIKINHLPWNRHDLIKVTRNIIAAPDDKFTAVISWKKGGKLMRINAENLPAPSALFLRLEKNTSCAITPPGPGDEISPATYIYPAGSRCLVNSPVIPNGYDFYVCIKAPDEQLYVLTETNHPEAFTGDLVRWQKGAALLDITISTNQLAGDYIFYSLFTPAGTNPLDSASTRIVSTLTLRINMD